MKKDISKILALFLKLKEEVLAQGGSKYVTVFIHDLELEGLDKEPNWEKQTSEKMNGDGEDLVSYHSTDDAFYGLSFINK